ncbi:MAG TPA: ABC transporter permease [Acidobacteriaceae bacterium]|jgi:predicted permease
MGALIADLRYALRQLRRAPGFAITAVLTLALGIGAATAVYSVAYGVLIDPFPYHDVKTLATPKICVPDQPRCDWRGYTPSQFAQIAQHTDIFSAASASAQYHVNLTGNGAPERLRGNYISANTFTVLGVQPILGRASSSLDVQPGHGEVALISYRFWQRHFGGKPSVLGTVIDVEHRSRTIIGVMPPRFLWRGADIYLPVALNSDTMTEGPDRYALVGRVRPGVTDAQAAAALQPLFEDFHKTNPTAYPAQMRLGLMPFAQMFASGLDDVLHLLLGAVVLLLLIACANVSSLLLARAVAREREFAVRSAIGASAWRLVRAAFTESLTLALIALPVALAFAYVSLQIILRIVPPETIPDEAVVTLNLPVLLAALGIACATILVFGMAPAWRSSRPHLVSAMQSSARSSSSRGQQRLLGGFVVTEIALSLALLTLAGLMIRSLVALESVPLSFDPDHTLVAGIRLSADRYPNADVQNHFYSQLLDHTRQLPGVRAVTIDGSWPLLDVNITRVQVEGQPLDQRINALHVVDPSYLSIAGRTLLAGHFIDQREIDQHAQEIVVSESFARRYLGGTVLGRVVRLPEFRPDEVHPLANDAFTIVGVVKDVPKFATYLQDWPEIFLPYSIAPQATGILLVETAVPPETLVTPLRSIAAEMDKDQPVTDAMSLRQILDMYGYAGPRFALTLFSTFATAAMLLTLVGIYGVLAFVTAQRTKEIGIRIALGAQPLHVVWMVVRQAAILAAIGVAVGLPLALTAGHFAHHELIHTSQRDPLTLILAICVLPLLALAGTLVPARRAAAINPTEALRAE